MLIATSLVALLPALASAPQCGTEVAVTHFGTGTPGTAGAPEMRSLGVPLIGTPHHLGVVGGPPDAQGFLLIGLATAELPLPTLGGTLYVPIPLGIQPFQLGQKGASDPLLTLIVQPAWCGLSTYSQAALVDPLAQGGIALTDALEVRYGVAFGPIFPGQSFPAGRGAHSLALADLDLDGVADLIAGSTLDSEVTWLPGLGGGTFGIDTPIGPAYGPDDLAAADLDQDGWPDVVATEAQVDQLALFFGPGSGHSAPVSISVGQWPRAVVPADMDADGDLDLVVAAFGDDAIEVLLGDGSGSFAPPLTHPCGNGPIAMQVLDLDGDLDLDVVTADWFDGASILKNQGSGALGAVQHVPVAGGNKTGIVASDFDANGHIDLALSSKNGSDVLVLLASAGSFAPPVTYPVGTGPEALVAGDVNRDGRLDLATADEHDDAGTVLFGQGDGTFAAAKPIAGVASPVAALAADLDGDAATDLVFASATADQLVVFVKIKAAFFRVPSSLAKGSGGFGEVREAYLDGDVNVDLVVANSNANEVVVYRGQKGGKFAAGQIVPTAVEPRGLARGDLNGDGNADFALAAGGFPAGVAGFQTLLGDGLGNLAPGQLIPTTSNPREVALGDLDGDSDLDAVVAGYGGANADVLRNDGSGSFGVSSVLGVGVQGTVDLELADLDGDGALDLVLGGLVPGPAGGAAILLGAGDGTFGPASGLAGVGEVSGLSLGDLDGDGAVDLVRTISFYDQIAVHMGQGNGSFGPAALHTVGNAPEGLCLGDVDDDGHIDVLTSEIVSVSLLRGLGDGGFQPAEGFVLPGVVGDLLAIDVNADGARDLVATTTTTLELRMSLLLE